MLAAQQWTRRFSYAHWGGYDDGKQVRTPLPQCHPRASMRKKKRRDEYRVPGFCGLESDLDVTWP